MLRVVYTSASGGSVQTTVMITGPYVLCSREVNPFFRAGFGVFSYLHVVANFHPVVALYGSSVSNPTSFSQLVRRSKMLR